MLIVLQEPHINHARKAAKAAKNQVVVSGTDRLLHELYGLVTGLGVNTG